jgi:hypothetical protein
MNWSNLCQPDSVIATCICYISSPFIWNSIVQVSHREHFAYFMFVIFKLGLMNISDNATCSGAFFWESCEHLCAPLAMNTFQLCEHHGWSPLWTWQIVGFHVLNFVKIVVGVNIAVGGKRTRRINPSVAFWCRHHFIRFLFSALCQLVFNKYL